MKTSPSVVPAPPFDASALVVGIEARNSVVIEEFYDILRGGLFAVLRHQVGSEHAEDLLHNAFVIVIKAVQAGGFRQPERLMGFSKTVVFRQIADHVAEKIKARRRRVDQELMGHSVLPISPKTSSSSMRAKHYPGDRSPLLPAVRGESRRPKTKTEQVMDDAANPEELFAQKERREICRRALATLNPRHQEVLIRFYLFEEPKEQILREMGLSYQIFRVLKNRAKREFGKAGKALLEHKLAA